MQYVEPLRNIEDIQAIKKVLRKQSQRDLLFFVFGINTGMRISDLLSLKVEDVWDGNDVKEFIYIKEEGDKGEEKAFYINQKMRRELKIYLSQNEFQMGDYLFKSKKDNKPISRQQAYRIINRAAKEAGISGRIGTHTIRKTFGYHAYRKGIAISIIGKIFNHQSPAETLKYLGIDKNEKHLIKVDVNL